MIIRQRIEGSKVTRTSHLSSLQSICSLPSSLGQRKELLLILRLERREKEGRVRKCPQREEKLKESISFLFTLKELSLSLFLEVPCLVRKRELFSYKEFGTTGKEKGEGERELLADIFREWSELFRGDGKRLTTS